MVKLRVKIGKEKRYTAPRTFSGAFIDKRCPKCGRRMYRVELLVTKADGHEYHILFRYCGNFRCRYCEYEEEVMR